MKLWLRTLSTALLAAALAPLPAAVAVADDGPFIDDALVERVQARLIETHGEAQAARIRQGVRQVAERWWSEDGDGDAFARFCEEHFLADTEAVDRAASRLEHVLEQVDGHLHEVRRELLTPVDLATGPVSALDLLLTEVDLAAHVDEDLYRARVPFQILLNFPIHTLARRLELGSGWDRTTWARSRMTERFARRVPAEVSQAISSAFNAASQYIDGYYIRMDRLVTPRGAKLFPENTRLIAHWGLRDELKSRYADGEQGLARQRAILRVMERIVRQEIPAEAIDNPDRTWCPETNELQPPGAAGREPDTRYEKLLDVYHAVRRADPYTPTAPTFVDRRFELERQIPESEVEKLLVSVLASDELADTARLIARRLGRPLEPFDIWYPGFKGAKDEPALTRLISERYPDVQAFQNDLPRILTALGFSDERARWLADHIVVDPSRGAGHATGAVRREDQAHLRTHFKPEGMDYKGYNIAIHELGHNIEQVFSLNAIDSWWLNGVPNTAFTEALAFTFQSRDLELLGLESPGSQVRALEALDTLWNTAEIAAVALVDMQVWNWMYRHPDATPADLRQATLAAAREVWNRYLAGPFGVRDQELLAIYSHMIAYGLYLPDYPIGHLIAHQVARKMHEGDFGAEFERISRQGRLTPDAWMRGAVGGPISAEALLEEARAALGELGRATN